MISTVARWTPARRSAADGGRLSGVAITVLVSLALGLLLRIAAAQGSLGLDEAWSLHAAVRLPSYGDAFWGLPHDNNHPLNTIWMAFLGAGRPEWLYRLPAVLLGVLTIGAVAKASAHAGPAAAGLGALLAAVSLPLVDFGSEARGYAGLTLASVIAIHLWRRSVAPCPVSSGLPARPPSPWWLAATVTLGALNHLAMLLTLAVLGAATLLLSGLRRQPLMQAVWEALRLFAPTALALLPVGACLAVAIARHGLRIGDVDPFAVSKLLIGMGGMTALTAGLPTSSVSPALMLILLLLLGRAAQRGLLSLPSAALCAAAFPLLMLGLALLRVPNTGYPRYFAICGIVLLISGAEVAGRLCQAGSRARMVTLACAAAVVASSLISDAFAIDTGRSGARDTLRIMAAEPHAAWATDRPVMAQLLLGAAARDGALPPATAVSCDDPPTFYVAIGTFDSRPDGSLTLDRNRCTLSYRVAATYASNPLSGTQWTLYRLGS